MKNKKSQTRIWMVWGAPRPLCTLFEANAPLVATDPDLRTLSGHGPRDMCQGFSRPLTQPHMFFTLRFEKQKVSNSFGANIPSIFALIVVHIWFNNKPVRLGIYRTNRDHKKPTLEQFIFAHLVCQGLAQPILPGHMIGQCQDHFQSLLVIHLGWNEVRRG